MIAYSRVFTWDSDSNTLFIHDGGWKILIGFAVLVVAVAFVVRMRDEI